MFPPESENVISAAKCDISRFHAPKVTYWTIYKPPTSPSIFFFSIPCHSIPIADLLFPYDNVSNLYLLLLLGGARNGAEIAFDDISFISLWDQYRDICSGSCRTIRYVDVGLHQDLLSQSILVCIATSATRTPWTNERYILHIIVYIFRVRFAIWLKFSQGPPSSKVTIPLVNLLCIMVWSDSLPTAL